VRQNWKRVGLNQRRDDVAGLPGHVQNGTYKLRGDDVQRELNKHGPDNGEI